jgi:hypothetical protein
MFQLSFRQEREGWFEINAKGCGKFHKDSAHYHNGESGDSRRFHKRGAATQEE